MLRHLCNATFSPLVYQTSHLTSSQHYHDDQGGISFFLTHPPPFTNWLLERTGWVAYVEPVGKTWIEPSGSCRTGRAEAVYVRAITAWCMQVLVERDLLPAQPGPGFQDHPLAAHRLARPAASAGEDADERTMP
jgi:hypothetical protein